MGGGSCLGRVFSLCLPALLEYGYYHCSIRFRLCSRLPDDGIFGIIASRLPSPGNSGEKRYVIEVMNSPLPVTVDCANDLVAITQLVGKRQAFGVQEDAASDQSGIMIFTLHLKLIVIFR